MNKGISYGFIILLVCCFTGCRQKNLQEAILPVVIEGDSQGKELLEKILKEKPRLHIREHNTEYSILVVKPDPNVDYKIAKVYPNPKIDYKIIVIDPKTGRKMPDLSHRFNDALRDKLKQKITK